LKTRKQRYGPFRVYTSPDVAIAQEMISALLPQPDQVFLAGDSLPVQRVTKKTDKCRIRIAGCDYFVKRYNSSGWLYGLKNLLRPSRALRSWRAALQFWNRQVPTPEPLLCLEERYYGFLGRSYILFPFLDDAIDLLNLWPQLDPSKQESCLYHLAPVIGHMHAQGVYHGDTNWRNILVRWQGEDWSFYLIDLDGCLFLKKPRKERALRDLQHFVRDLERHQVSPRLQDLFLEKWEQALLKVR